MYAVGASATFRMIINSMIKNEQSIRVTKAF